MTASKEKCMTDRQTQASEAIREAWAFWLSQHPVSLGDIITDAVEAATGKWLASKQGRIAGPDSQCGGRRRPCRRRERRQRQGGEMSFETRKQDAEKVLKRWNKPNQSPAAQKRLIADNERLWRLARDLAEALDNLLAHVRSVQHGYAAVARRRWPTAEWIIGEGHCASVARCGTVTVMLFATPAEADRAKALIDRTGCGGACRGDHEVTDLDDTQDRSR